MVSKVLGTKNVAVIGTKPLSASVFNKHCESLGCGASPEDREVIDNTVGGGQTRARQVTAAVAARVSAKVMTLAIALAQCLERTDGQEVALVQAAPTLSVTVHQGRVTWITEEMLLFIIVFVWILSLMCTPWCSWKAGRIWKSGQRPNH